MIDFLQNILKKHTPVCGKNIFLPPRFLNTKKNTENENPESPKPKKKEVENTEENTKFVFDSKKIENVIRTHVAEILAKKQEPAAKIAYKNTEKFAEEVFQAVKAMYLRNIMSIIKEAEKNENPDEKRKALQEAIREMGKKLEIPVSIQNVAMSEFETSDNIKSHIKNFESFLEKIIKNFLEKYKTKITLEKLLEDNGKLFSNKKEQNNEESGADLLIKKKRKKKRIKDGIEKIIKEENIDFQEDMSEAIFKALEPIMDKAFDEFKIDENDPGVREAFQNNEKLRTELLVKYGEYKDKEWNIKITEEQMKESPDLFLKKQLAGLKNLQAEIKEDIEALKQTAKIDNAIKIYDLDNVNLGDEGASQSMGDRLFRNNGIIARSKTRIQSLKKEIKIAEGKIKDPGGEDKKVSQADLEKKKKEIAEQEIELKEEEAKIGYLQQEIDWVLEKYNPNEEESERTKTAQEMIVYTREQAVNYLIKEPDENGKNGGGWLSDEFLPDEYDKDRKVLFIKDDKKLLEQTLRGEKKGLTDKQILDFYQKQKNHENDPTNFPHPFPEFQEQIKNTARLMDSFNSSYNFYDNFIETTLHGNIPASPKSISNQNLQSFIEIMCNSAAIEDEETDPKKMEKKTKKFKALAGILKEYLGGDKSKELYYNDSELDKIGKEDKEDTVGRLTIGAKGKDMMFNLLYSYKNENRVHSI